VTNTLNLTGASSCTACGSGQYSASSQVACAACGTGSVAENGTVTGVVTSGATTCTACAAGTYSAVSTTACAACGAGSITNTLNGTAATSCTACAPGQYSASSQVSCALCPPGSATDTTSLPGGSTCTPCGPGRYSATSTTACIVCGPGNMTTVNSTFVTTAATSCDQCSAASTAGSVSNQANTAVIGSRGYADLDGSSATACHACQPGTYAATNGSVQCVDFDECASNPCRNGARCSQPSLTGTGILGGDTTRADFHCQCILGFIGDLCQSLNECLLNPCALSSRSISRHGTGGPTSSSQFLCPVAMNCTDPDTTVTDNYICTCPACVDSALSTGTATALSTFFNSHLSFRRFVTGELIKAGQQAAGAVDMGTCKVKSVQGCTDPTALNYNALAATQGTATCTPKIYGCMDKRAINYMAAANAYDPDDSDSSRLCHGAFCVSNATCMSIFATVNASCAATNPSIAADVYTCGNVTGGNATAFAAACASASVCTHVAGGGPANIAAACSAVDVSAQDTYTAVTRCEQAGAPFVVAGSQYSGYSTVCRYQPSRSTLCAHSHTGANGMEVHGGPTDCSCPAGQSLLQLSDGNVSRCVPAAAGATQGAVDTCATKTQTLCTGSCMWMAYPAVSRDECTATTYNSASYSVCSSAEHRLCAVPGGAGSAGFICTDFRQAFTCPDHRPGSTAFNCTDTNPYWADDYTCSCAYENGRYNTRTAAACGADLLYTERSAAVSNYDMAFFLQSSPLRSHICGNIGSPSDCTG
jgi:hypothetical protein